MSYNRKNLVWYFSLMTILVDYLSRYIKIYNYKVYLYTRAIITIVAIYNNFSKVFSRTGF